VHPLRVDGCHSRVTFRESPADGGGIQVFNPDGGHSGEAGFYFNALPPQIASNSPSSTAANSPGFNADGDGLELQYQFLGHLE
jgi:hypothetical protein